MRRADRSSSWDTATQIRERPCPGPILGLAQMFGDRETAETACLAAQGLGDKTCTLGLPQGRMFLSC